MQLRLQHKCTESSKLSSKRRRTIMLVCERGKIKVAAECMRYPNGLEQQQCCTIFADLLRWAGTKSWKEKKRKNGETRNKAIHFNHSGNWGKWNCRSNLWYEIFRCKVYNFYSRSSRECHGFYASGIFMRVHAQNFSALQYYFPLRWYIPASIPPFSLSVCYSVFLTSCALLFFHLQPFAFDNDRTTYAALKRAYYHVYTISSKNQNQQKIMLRQVDTQNNMHTTTP